MSQFKSTRRAPFASRRALLCNARAANWSSVGAILVECG